MFRFFINHNQGAFGTSKNQHYSCIASCVVVCMLLGCCWISELILFLSCIARMTYHVLTADTALAWWMSRCRYMIVQCHRTPGLSKNIRQHNEWVSESHVTHSLLFILWFSYLLFYASWEGASSVVDRHQDTDNVQDTKWYNRDDTARQRKVYWF